MGVDDVPSRLVIGRVGRAHGLAGDVIVTASTNRAERFEPGSVLFAGERELRVERARPYRDRWLVHFEGLRDRGAAEALRGLVLEGEPLGEAPAGEVWVHELIGCVVRDRAGTGLGTVVAVQANPASDLLELETGALIPLVFVTDLDPGGIVVDVPEGLLEVNEAAPPAPRP